jgi:CubicO group peptidase (beta-lactamase class C family)
LLRGVSLVFTSLTASSLASSLTLAQPPAQAFAQTAAPASALDSIAASFVTGNRTVGLVAAVAKGSDTLLLRSYGKADVEWDVPMPVDAMFEIGSVAKQFAAVSILQLRDAGVLSLDDPLTKWLPSVNTEGRPITLRHLLTHTSGIFRFTETDEWERSMFLPGYPRDSAMRLVKLTPYQFTPGEAQAYSNGGFWLLGLVVEKASGMKYEEYLAKRIFEPLAMSRSMFCNSLQHVPRRAHGYGLTNGVMNRAPMVSYAWVFAPGAVCSTAGDLVTWLRALHGGKVLSAKSYAEMTTPARLADGTAVQYGFGIKVGTDMRGLRYIGHGGTAPGFRADAMWYPDAKMAVVVLMNTSAPNLSAADLGTRLTRAVLPLQRPQVGFYTGDPAPFVGTYQLTAGGNIGQATLVVTSTPAGLAFSMNGSRAQPLPWIGGNVFQAGETTTLSFTRIGNAAATDVRRDDAGNHAVLRRK